MKILRTIGILALVAGLVLATGGAVFAQEPELADIKGVIKAVDTEVGEVTILPEKGETVTLTITGETEVYKDGGDATINDLAKDDEVEALYNPGTLEAVKIVAKSPEPAETPEPEETAEPAETPEPEENGGPAGEPRAGGSPERGPHSPGKRHGFFGEVDSVVESEGEYILTLTTEEWTVTVTLTDTTKYMVPRVTRGPVVGLAEFEDALDALGESITTIEGRVAVLAGNVVGKPEDGVFTGDAVRLMLIPSSPLHSHLVGIVQAFSEGTSITIIDEDDVTLTHTFTLLNGTVYRPAKIDPSTEIVEGVSVTVVTKGDLEAKAIVLHKKTAD